ncbi:MAG: DUF2933 domain-containing protein [Acidimicrobiales bacterium]
MMGMCINKKVVIGLVAVAGGVLLFAPQAIGAALPLLVLLVCPLSMMFMMRGMSGGESRGTKQAESASTSADNATTEGSQDEPELVRLRAEVDQLRAEMRDRQARRDAVFAGRPPPR